MISKSTSADQTHPVHILSDRSIAQKRDIFVFFAQPQWAFHLCGGLNSERTKPTIEAFYRWLDLINDSTGDDPYRIWRIEVERLHILTYQGPRVGEALSRSSSDYVMPGDYGSFFFNLDGTVTGFPIGVKKQYFNLIEQENEVRDLLDEWPDEVETLKLNEISPQWIQEVQERDDAVCLITGQIANEAQILWIAPPAWHDFYVMGQQETHEYITTDNIITLDKRLATLFMENRFAIDADDEYRIVIFQDLPDDIALPSNLPTSSVEKFEKRADLFFKGHLKWTLGVNFLAGDILDQYPDCAQSLIDNACSPEFDINAPVWDTPLGKDILGQLME